MDVHDGEVLNVDVCMCMMERYVPHVDVCACAQWRNKYAK